MSIVYTGSFNTEFSPSVWTLLNDDLYCNENEDYLTTPRADGITIQSSSTDIEIYRAVYDGVNLVGSSVRYAFYINTASGIIGDQIGYTNLYSTANLTSNGSALQYPFVQYNGRVGPKCTGFIQTNLPVFATQAEAVEYTNPIITTERAHELIKNALNYVPEIINNIDDTTNDYYIYDRYQMSHVERGIVTTVESIVHQQNERILYNGERGIALYRDSENPFQFNILCNTSNLVGSIYSSTSVSDVSGASYDEFTLDTLLYDSPFYSTYNSRFEVYTYDGYLGQFDTNLPLWDSLQDAQDYLDGVLDITESPNWDKISGDNVYKDIITNLTELPEEATEFGEVFVRNVFSQLYLCDTGSLYDISNSLFDYTPDATIHGQWEKIKQGLEMYGSNPMDAVQGLRFYPFDLSSIFTNVQAQNYVYFGAYKQDISGSVYKLIYANGYKDLGSVTIKRTFKDWRDFEPYTRLYIYLPYVGRFQLDLTKYYDKTVNIRYYIDLRTGVCCACLIANGVLLDWFDGIIGTEMPITLTDYASYAQTQLSIIARNAGIGGLATALTGNAINKELATHLGTTEVPAASGDAFASLASTSSGAAGTAGMMASGVGFAAGVGAVVAAAVMKTRFDMTNNGIGKYNSTRGTSSAMINQFLPQYPTFMFEVQEIDESPYLNELYGRPSNASGVIGDFSGYFEAEDIMLICPIATDNERQEIIDLVRSGIYI